MNFIYGQIFDFYNIKSFICFFAKHIHDSNIEQLLHRFISVQIKVSVNVK